MCVCVGERKSDDGGGEEEGRKKRRKSVSCSLSKRPLSFSLSVFFQGGLLNRG